MSMVPDVISSFQHMYPHVNFQLTQASNQQIIEQLTSREVDIALTSLRDENDEVICQPLLTEELYLAVSAEHPLASYDEIDLKMAEHEPFISFKDTNVLHGMIKELCEKAGFSPDVVFEGEDIVTASGLVGAKLGCLLSLTCTFLIKQRSNFSVSPIRSVKERLVWLGGKTAIYRRRWRIL